MFTSKADSPKTKTDNSSSQHRSTSFGHQHAHTPLNDVLRLQRTVGNQATLKLLQQLGPKSAGSIAPRCLQT